MVFVSLLAAISFAISLIAIPILGVQFVFEISNVVVIIALLWLGFLPAFFVVTAKAFFTMISPNGAGIIGAFANWVNGFSFLIAFWIILSLIYFLVSNLNKKKKDIHSFGNAVIQTPYSFRDERIFFVALSLIIGALFSSIASALLNIWLYPLFGIPIDVAFDYFVLIQFAINFLKTILISGAIIVVLPTLTKIIYFPFVAGLNDVL